MPLTLLHRHPPQWNTPRPEWKARRAVSTWTCLATPRSLSEKTLLRRPIHRHPRRVLPPGSSTYGKYACVALRSAPRRG